MNDDAGLPRTAESNPPAATPPEAVPIADGADRPPRDEARERDPLAPPPPEADQTRPSVRERLRRLTTSWDRGVALIASALFAISFGFNYGVNNQVVYLLGSLRIVDHSLLAKDWYTTETTQYHFAFKYLGALLIALSPKGWAMAAAQATAITVGAMFLHSIAKGLLRDKRLALAAFGLMLAIAFTTGTRGPGGSYAFDEIFQPSTLGTVGLLAAVAFFVDERWLASGIALAFSGAFHANYLVLEVPAFIAAQLFLGRGDFKRRMLRQLLPPMLVLLATTPVILASSGGPNAVKAQEILAAIRSPHHYNIGAFERDFLPWIGWQLAGTGALLTLGPSRGTPAFRLAAAVGSLSAVIWGGIVLATAFKMRAAVLLFSWRIEPHVELIFQVAICAAAVSAASGEIRRASRVAAAALGLLGAGVGVLFMFYGNRDKLALPEIALAIVVCGLVLALASTATDRRPAARSWYRRVVPWALAAVGTTAGLLSGYRALPQVKPRSSLLRGADVSTAQLCDWAAAHTSKDAQFLIPPDHESFRFRCQRPVVVDWKSVPIIPDEVVAWYGRLEDVTGNRIRSRRDLGGYASLDEKRLERLKQKYPIDYIMVRKGSERSLPALKVVYSNRAYSVLAAH
jgi:hypothetical protein